MNRRCSELVKRGTEVTDARRFEPDLSCNSKVAGADALVVDDFAALFVEEGGKWQHAHVMRYERAAAKRFAGGSRRV
jgi:hypothetical protein